MDNRFLFIGGDRRIIYAAGAIARRRSVSALGFDGFAVPEGRYGAVVLPLPFMRDGAVNAPMCSEKLPLSLVAEYAQRGGTVFSGGSSQELASLCEENGLRLVDYFAQEPLTLKNAALTAEAAVALLIQNTEFSLCGARVLITGGGRIAGLTARLLRSFGSSVCICARSAEQRAKAQLEYHETAVMGALVRLCGDADIIINTVPAPLFTQEHFIAMRPRTLFMQLAGGDSDPAAEHAEKYGVRYLGAGGLPGRFSPKTAGEAIAEAILADA